MEEESKESGFMEWGRGEKMGEKAFWKGKH